MTTNTPGYDAEKANQTFPALPTTPSDISSGLKNFEHDFDATNAAKLKRPTFYGVLRGFSLATKWFLYVIPFLGIVWVPGILALTKFPSATVWGVKLLWWSIWLSVVWAGWWAALVVSVVIPRIFRGTVGVVAVGSRRYIVWLAVLHRYVAFFAWTLAVWISWNPLIDSHQANASTPSIKIIDLIGRLLFVFFLCAALLLFEKFAIQWIAGKFHERSYADRIASQRFAVKSLATLYEQSVDTHRRFDDPYPSESQQSSYIRPSYIIKSAFRQFKAAATTTTTALGNVASQIAGTSVLQPNSPAAIVKTALESTNKSRSLARRLFHSFVKPGASSLVVDDIASFFPSQDDANLVFALLDKDGNGDVTRDELEMVCIDLHREQITLERSMQDLDSAVGRLDNILMTVYFFVVIIFIAVALDTQVTTLLTGAGATVLALSWLIGSSLQEVLISIIFLFIKHPFDVGDRINVNKTDYTVKEIRLLSSIFLESNGTLVQAPNTVLNSMFIQNMRRSPQMSESFTFDVNYSTTFDQLEDLRHKMIAFLQNERRDFLPSFDVSVVDFPDQSKMTLKVDIKYKSNWQHGALKVQRRNKWICALKMVLAEAKIFGPSGDPNAKHDPTRYTQVPWEEVQMEERRTAKQPNPLDVAHAQNWGFFDKTAVILDPVDLFDEQTHMANIRKSSERQAAQLAAAPSTAAQTHAQHPVSGSEAFEMTTRP